MREPIPVLDHGYVLYQMHMGTDETIVRAARQSTDGSFRGWEPYQGHPRGDAGFLEFLFKHAHTSPFEMCELVVEVQAPIMVFREWHRHRTMSYNEMSGRYVKMPNQHYVPAPDRMVAQSQTNKQASAELLLDAEEGAQLIQLIEQEQQGIYATYNLALAKGLAREVARINTPVSRYSRMWAKANLSNWLRFLKLRMAPNAQKEIRVYADAVASIVKQLWPRTWALFEEYDLYARKLSRTELAEYNEWLASKNAPNTR